MLWESLEVFSTDNPTEGHGHELLFVPFGF